MPFQFSRPILPFVACAALAAISACSGGDGGGIIITPPPGNASFRWMNPVSEGATLSDVWGPAADNLFASGSGGIVLRFDGDQWRRTKTPVSENLNAIWGVDASHAFAVGQNGTILFFNGSSWAAQASPTTQSLNDVWGTSATDVYAVGQQREVIHFDGASWDTMSVATGIEALYSVWGSSSHDIYATGLGKKLLHYNGTAWGEVQTNSSFALNAVWGTDSMDVFVVGGNGAASHYDGLAWSNIDIGESLFPNTVWGTATTDVYAMGFAAGAASPAYHWDGFSWTPVDMHSYKGFTRVFGVDGAVFAVGQAGLIHEKSGNEFVAMPGGLSVDLEAVWVSDDGADAFAAGDFGTILHFKDGKWSTMTSGTSEHLRGLGGTSGADVLAVGENGVVLHYNGADWSDASPGIPVAFNEAWMDAPNSAFVVGEGGTVERLENGVWSLLSLGSVTENLLSVWGSSANNVYVVGNQSTAFKWTGTQFKIVVIAPGGSYNFHGVYGTGPDDVFIGAELRSPPPPSPLHAGGAIYHWNGDTWISVFTDPVHDVLSIWRANDHEGFATGDSNSLLRNASGDNGWVRVWDVDNLPFYVNAVWGSSMKNVFIAGDDGALVRFSP